MTFTFNTLCVKIFKFLSKIGLNLSLQDQCLNTKLHFCLADIIKELTFLEGMFTARFLSFQSSALNHRAQTLCCEQLSVTTTPNFTSTSVKVTETETFLCLLRSADCGSHLE